MPRLDDCCNRIPHDPRCPYAPGPPRALCEECGDEEWLSDLNDDLLCETCRPCGECGGAGCWECSGRQLL